MTINISAADLATLNAGGSVPLQGPTAVVTPPPISTAIAVYEKGKFSWAGDWSNGTFVYNSTASLGIDGVSPCIQGPAGSPWGYWLPYPPVTAGAPAANGIGCNLAGTTHVTLAVKAAKAFTMTMGFYSATSTTNDVPFGKSVTVTLAKYGPATMVPNAWNVYIIPLADFGITPGWIYKFILQQQDATSIEWFLDQVGFG